MPKDPLPPTSPRQAPCAGGADSPRVATASAAVIAVGDNISTRQRVRAELKSEAEVIGHLEPGEFASRARTGRISSASGRQQGELLPAGAAQEREGLT